MLAPVNANKGKFRVHSSGAGTMDDPVITGLQEGGGLVSWQDTGIDTYGIRAQLYGTGGRRVGGEFSIKSGAYGHAVAALDNGGFAVTWQEVYWQPPAAGGALPVTEIRIKARLYQENGEPAGEAFQVAETTTIDASPYSANPQISRLGNGGFIVAWLEKQAAADDYAIRAQFYNEGGTALGDARQLKSFTGSASTEGNYGLHSQENGRLLLTWTATALDNLGLSSVSRTSGQYFSEEGEPAGKPFPLDTAIADFPFQPLVANSAIPAWQGGGFLHTWSVYSPDGLDWEVYARRHTGTGTSLDEAFRVNTSRVNSQDSPAVTGTADGGFAIVWLTNGGEDSTCSPVSAPFSRTAFINGQRCKSNGLPCSLAASISLTGTEGSDTLSGGTGHDELWGRLGQDVFRFDSPLDADTNVDRIMDFTPDEDKIALRKEVFQGLGSNTYSGQALAAGLFVAKSNGTARDADGCILYSTASGALFYDADGNGEGVAVQFATLENKPSLKAGDFAVISW